MAPKKAPLDHSVFFSNIPYATTAGYVRKIFSRVGKVEDVEFFTDARGGSIGAGVAVFDSPEAAARAVAEINGTDVDGRPIQVKPNEREARGKGSGKGDPEATVFFNGVPYATTEGFLRAKFERYGTIVDFDFWRRPDGTSQGMGTCEYATAADAQNAIDGLHGTVVDGRYILVQMDKKPERKEEASEDGDGESLKWCEKGHDTATAYAPKGFGKAKGKGRKGVPDRRVFWSDVPKTTSEGYLRAQFERVGTIVNFDFWRKDDGTSLGMGVCEFDHHLGAWRAVERLSGTEIDGQTIVVKMDDGGRAGGKGKGKGKGKAPPAKGKGKGKDY